MLIRVGVGDALRHTTVVNSLYPASSAVFLTNIYKRSRRPPVHFQVFDIVNENMLLLTLTNIVQGFVVIFVCNCILIVFVESQIYYIHIKSNVNQTFLERTTTASEHRFHKDVMKL